MRSFWGSCTILGAYRVNIMVGLGWVRRVMDAILAENDVKAVTKGLVFGAMINPTLLVFLVFVLKVGLGIAL